jgi:hypothetical protein
MSRMTAEEKKKLASEILSYLLKNPEAGDTLEGIARFWTTRQRIDLMLEDVQDVLEDLVAEELLKERLLRAPNGSSSQRYYQLNPTRKKDIERNSTPDKPGPEHKDPTPPSR